ncbi:MAG TPA: quinone-dependent dihydroorotate dehydrogenase [Stellaceae bacterium]|jgi:dihydroorotate dehydrogenase|nr:quinone-dependent dihydroorotate dehydrogenase [Stellaceae bacterium]
MSLANLALPLLRLLPAESAHGLTIKLMKAGFAPRDHEDDLALAQELWGLRFRNPVGLAAGFDKNAEVPDIALRAGFGFAEIGTVTPRPQPGNPLPRLFRLPEDRAVINRMGFNNEGLEAAMARLARRSRGTSRGPVGANLGKNKDSTDAVEDYRLGIAAAAPLADYLVVNISSPNTPGLRDLQRKSALAELIEAVQTTRDGLALGNPPPILLKIAPDLAPEDVEDVAAIARDFLLDGVIISNTTIARPESLKSRNAPEPGGLSGKPLFEPSTVLLGQFYRMTSGKIPLVGVGGISSGAEAYAKIRAGASLVQLYSALVFEGPGLVRRIKDDLLRLMRADGFKTIGEAVGADHVPAGQRQSQP